MILRSTGQGDRHPDRDPPRRGQQHRPATTAGAQRDHLRGLAVGGPEAVGEAPDGVHVGPAEGVDGLVRVADGDQLAAAGGELAQQLLLGRVDVLVLVHADRVVGVALPGQHGLAAQQAARDPDDLGVVVGRHRREVEAGGVIVKELAGRDPVVAAATTAELGQAAPVEAALGRPEQEVAQLGREPPGGQGRAQPVGPAPAAVGGLAAQQPAHLQQLLGAGQQRGRLVPGQHELAADQGVGVAVEGQRQRPPGRRAQAQGDPLPELLGRLAAEGEHEQPGRIDATVGDSLGHGLDEGGGLAGAGPGQHEQRAALVLDDLALGGVEHRRAGRRDRRADQAVGAMGGRGTFHLVWHSSRGCRHSAPGLAVNRSPTSSTAFLNSQPDGRRPGAPRAKGAGDVGGGPAASGE